MSPSVSFHVNLGEGSSSIQDGCGDTVRIVRTGRKLLDDPKDGAICVCVLEF